MRGRRRATLALTAFAATIALSVTAHAAPDAAAERGLARMRALGCLACHTVDGGRQVGPTFLGAFGSRRRVLTDGALREVTFDEDYVARSLTEPNADVADGYPAGAMPSFALDDAARTEIVAALRHLSQNAASRPRGSLVGLVISSLLFVALHLVMSSHPVRSRAVTKLGERGFQGIYSLVIVAVFGWMLWAWSRAPFVPLWPSPAWTRYVPLLGMPLILVLMIAGYTTKNPTTAGQESQLASAGAVAGILRVTRHPVNVSNALWGLVHLPPNGDVASLCLFGSIALLAILGTLHIERRRRGGHGREWDEFASATSIVPFSAILRGKNRLVLREIGAWRVALGLAIYVVALLSHTYVIGASPYPF